MTAATQAAPAGAGGPGTWEVYALRYGRKEGVVRDHFYGGDPHDDPFPLDFFVWVLRSGDRAILVDAGHTEATASARGRTLTEPVPEVLRRMGMEIADFTEVIVTHLHYDHAGHLHDVPRARMWVQDEEIRFWTGPHAGRASFLEVMTPEDVVSVVRANFERRVVHLSGDAQVAPGVTVHRTGGHSAGMQVVRVQTAAGPLVLASDVAHIYANLEQDRPYKILHSLPLMHEAFDRVLELAGPGGIWVPGHDPDVMRRFPCAGTGLEDIVVRLG